MSRFKKVLCAAVAAVQVMGLISFGAAAEDQYISVDTIAVGSTHSLVIKSDLSLWAAGSNLHGQLGAGNQTSESDGVKIMDNIIAVEASGETSFAIDGNGTLYGWGDNTKGQIQPDKVTKYFYSPQKLMDNVVSVDAGDGHTVAVTTNGTAYGWGSNADGELGFSANNKANECVKLMDGIIDAAAGDDFTALVTEDGNLYISGDNGSGQFGLGNYKSYTKFTKATEEDIISVEAGNDHILLLKGNKTVYAAGANDNNQVCKEEDTRINKFVKLDLSNIDAVFADSESSAAVNSIGALFVWGNNDCGQLQNKNTEDIITPYKVCTDVISFAVGEHHSAVLKNDGSVVSAGKGMSGELFFFSDSSVLEPERIMADVTKYAAGTDHAAAISKGVLYTWGNNDCGQLGTGDLVARTEPTKLDLPSTPVDVWCGAKCTFVRTDDKRVFVFGDNSNGMLGTNTKTAVQNTPKLNLYLSDYNNMDISCGDGFCIALIDGTVYGWGTNVSGRLCDLSKKVDNPEALSDKLNNIVMVAAGANHCIAINESGELWGWGANGNKQLGDSIYGLFVDIPEIIEVKEVRKEEQVPISYIDAAGNHSIVYDIDGRVWVWGMNTYYQLGREDTRVKDVSLTGYLANKVSAGKYACAIVNNNSKLLLSGSNRSGALGDGTKTDRTSFNVVTATSVDTVDLGEYFGGYIREDGVLFCWGDNSVGQVGNGKGGVTLNPEKVLTDAICKPFATAEGITLNKTELIIKPGSSQKITATITPADADVRIIKWSSSDTTVATVSADGTIKAVANGKAVITATAANGIKAECNVTVTIPVSSFSVSPSKTKSLKIGQSFTFSAKVYPSTAVDKTLLFESSDPDVVKVSAKGKVTAVSAGSAKITVKAKSNPEKVKTVTVYVRPAKTTFSSRKATADGVLFKWKQTAGADGYTIYRSTSAKGKSTAIADISADEALTYLDANAKSGKTYYYYIKAYIEDNGKKIYSSSYSLYKVKAK